MFFNTENQLVNCENEVDRLKEEIADLEAENEWLRMVLHSEELLEALADLEHERWSGWMQYQFDNWTEENIERWKRQMVTPYKDLPDYSQESDRKEVRKTLAVIDALLKRGE